MLCVIQDNGSVLGFYADSDNPNYGHPMSLSRSNRLELCRVRLAYLLTDGRLALTEPQTSHLSYFSSVSSTLFRSSAETALAKLPLRFCLDPSPLLSRTLLDYKVPSLFGGVDG
jgi:hypothetical protein